MDDISKLIEEAEQGLKSGHWRGNIVERLLAALRSGAAVPVERDVVLSCTVDESGGMAELVAARELLAAAYGAGEWVPFRPDREEGTK